ncbi:efflux RND transporter periplasmic adaptor subunit [Devosia limi]|uniref:RND family efflux transporter, MFP subunit n=1 Tax=Devosia limi DSM 17137 TaxID=1121477 RepID=A0A1M5BD60_9HYPH|nr:efflux RND transporter periplasmic adaptor subunit [Devosia limi]SHF40346.1 RND family efflux transporter, MFP subunit [Devosia limi DSM 17137]
MVQQAEPIDNSKPEWALTRRERKRQALLAAGITPRRVPWVWILAVAAVAGGAAYVLIPQLTATEAATPVVAAVTPDPVKRLLSLDVTTLAPQAVQETLKATGSLAPRRTIGLTSQVGGTVSAVNFRIGDTVKAGDVLVQVDIETLSIQLQQQKSTAEATRAQLALAQTTVERTAKLLERGLVPSANLDAEQSRLEALQSNLKALEGQVAAAEIGLRNATIVAPFDGVVAARSVEPGQVTAPGAALMQLVDLSVMEMTAYVPVSASPSVSPGQPVMLTVEGLPGRQFEGSVDGISPVATQGTRTVPVLVTVANPEGELRGGMFATGHIVTAAADAALAVPPAAIREDAEGDYILKIVDGALVRQPVEPGRNWPAARMTELSAGLAVGDSFVSGRLDDLQPGMQVVVVEN